MSTYLVSAGAEVCAEESSTRLLQHTPNTPALTETG